MLIGDDERGLRLHEQQLAAARRTGALSHGRARPDPRSYLPDRHRCLDPGGERRGRGAVADRRHRAPGLTALPLAELALVAALRGEDAADGHLAEVSSIRERHPVGITDRLVVDLAHWARGCAPRPAGHGACTTWSRSAPRGSRRLAAVDLFETAVRAGAARPRSCLARRSSRTFAAASGPPRAHGGRRARARAAGRRPAATPSSTSSSRSRRTPNRRGCLTELAPSWRTASTCAAPAAGSMPGRTCARRSPCSRSSVRQPGPSEPRQELRASGETARTTRRLHRDRPDRAGAQRHRPGPTGAVDQGRRGPALRQPPHGRLPPAQRLHQARCHLTRRADGAAARRVRLRSFRSPGRRAVGSLPPAVDRPRGRVPRPAGSLSLSCS